MEQQAEEEEEQQLERLDSESSGAPSTLTIAEDPASARSSSGDLFSSSGPGSSSSSGGGSSGEIPGILCAEAAAASSAPRRPLLPAGPARSGEGLAEAVETETEDAAAAAAAAGSGRHKCVGRNNRGVAWGFTSVIGRRKEMEDAVAVVPGFMSRACGHVGGCSAPGSRASGEISPVHFFGVYDGHGGSQVTATPSVPYSLITINQLTPAIWPRN